MKKTVVVDMEYMRPSTKRTGRSRSRSRSQSRSQSQKSVNHITTSAIEKSGLCDQYEFDDMLDVGALLDRDNDTYGTDDSGLTSDGSNERDTSDGSDGSDGSVSIDSSSRSKLPQVNDNKCCRPPTVKDTDYAANSDDDLLQSVLDEPTFPLDVNAILSAMTNSKNSTIANMTLKQIEARRHEVLSSMNLSPEKMAEFEDKLQMFRVIEHPDELKHNQLIRWIPLRSLETNPYITIGGYFFRVTYNAEDSIHNVTIQNVKKFIFNIKFELNAVFQRLSQEELLILRAVEYVESDSL